MIQWELKQDSAHKRKFWGWSEAKDDAEVVESFSEQWRKVFADVLPWYPAEKWDSLECACIIVFGSFDFGPSRGYSEMTALPGCWLGFSPLKGYLNGDFPDLDEFDAACAAEKTRYSGLLMRAWEAVRGEAVVTDLLRKRPIPFRVITSPDDDEPTLVETILQWE